MKTLLRGQRFPLPQDMLSLFVSIHARSANLAFDVSCLGLDAKGHLSDENFFVFYNQPCAPKQSIQLLEGVGGDLARFEVNLSELPPTIQKLVWVLTIDGQGTMNALQEGSFRLSANEQLVTDFHFTGADYGSEKAVMVVELYERNGWRLSANGQGFAGGLDAVLRHFGAQVADDSASESKAETKTEEGQASDHSVPSLSHELPESEKTPCDESSSIGHADPDLPIVEKSPSSKTTGNQATASRGAIARPNSKPVRSTTPIPPAQRTAAPLSAPFETVMDFSDRLRTIASRVPALLPRLSTEEATKNALVMPFIGALGYDVFDPLEVIPNLWPIMELKKARKWIMRSSRTIKSSSFSSVRSAGAISMFRTPPNFFVILESRKRG